MTVQPVGEGETLENTLMRRPNPSAPTRAWRKPRRRGGQWSSRATARAVAGFLGVTTRAHERRGCRDGGTRAPLPSSRTPQCFGVIFPAKFWLTIFPSFTTNEAVPHGYRCSVI